MFLHNAVIEEYVTSESYIKFLNRMDFNCDELFNLKYDKNDKTSIIEYFYILFYQKANNGWINKQFSEYIIILTNEEIISVIEDDRAIHICSIGAEYLATRTKEILTRDKFITNSTYYQYIKHYLNININDEVATYCMKELFNNYDDCMYEIVRNHCNDELWNWFFKYLVRHNRDVMTEFRKACYFIEFPNSKHISMFKIASKYMDLNNLVIILLKSAYHHSTFELITFLFKVDYSFDYPLLLIESKQRGTRIITEYIEKVLDQV